MGKTKTKYPVEITLQFCLLLTQNYLEKQVVLKIHTPFLTYENIKKPYAQFLQQYKINYPTVMAYSIEDDKQQITQDFQINIQIILDEFGGTFIIIVQNYFQASIEKIFYDIEQIKTELEQIKERINDFPTRQEITTLRKNTLPVLHHNQSNMPQITYEQKQIDMGVLFSEPIFDQIKDKMAANPVDFRSQIQRLHIALKSSIKPDVTLKCQIGTRQNLKHLIKYYKPRILHIICHGTSQGQLQFEDDSRTVLGALQLLNGADIMNALKGLQKILPEVVFVNSCHSQKVGQAFHKMGVNYVITIDSQDKIQDEAAQIFSEHFYRNIFNGQKVKQAFKQARQRVKMKHNYLGCCCRHSSKQVHKPNCRWLQMIKKTTNIYDQIQLHKLFHIPSELCKCLLKNLNRHQLSCQWAKLALFNINNDFRIPDENGNFRFPQKKQQLPKYLPKDSKDQFQLVICCCFNYQGASQQTGQYRLPHSESNKFKILQNLNQEHKQNVFEVVPRNVKQLIDYTSPELVETHQKIQSSIMGRQKQIYNFMKVIKDLNQVVYIIHGKVGVGRTSFALKCVTYLIQRKVFQMYFYIDLYDIKDRDIFRYKFNQITKFNYDGEIKINQVKNKSIIIILDNADDFFQSEKQQLYDQLKYLRQQLHKGKIILSMKQENCATFDLQKIHAETFYLPILTCSIATNVIFTKMRHLFQANVQFSDIDGLVRSNQSLRIPKIIQSLCQSFSSLSGKKKIKVADIKKKVQDLGDGDTSGFNFIKENLQILQQKSQQSYQLLLFISQFSEGISIDDIKMLSLYDKKESIVHLPINVNWESNFANLFQKFKVQSNQKDNQQISSVITQESDSIPTPALNKNAHSISPSILEGQKQKQGKKVIKGQSYFLDEVSQNRFIVKRYIREYIWKKHESQSNKYMKYIFVGYMALMLQAYFKWLIESKYIHEDLIQYSALTSAGLFSFKNNIFEIPSNSDLTRSVSVAREYNSQFTKIFSKSNAILQKIKKSDPSSFFTNHKRDFLNIYQKSWDSVLRYLKQTKQNYFDKICMGYIYNLMIYIPTAFKIAKVEIHLLKYVITKSMSLLMKIQQYSQEQKYAQNEKILAIQLKLQLMNATIEIQKNQVQNIKQQLQFNKGMNLGLVKSINNVTFLQYLKKYWNFQKTYILMYKQYISRKYISNKTFSDKSKISSDKLKASIDNINAWMMEKWDQSEEIIMAKRNLIIGLTYLNVLKHTMASVNALAATINLKRIHEKAILELVNSSYQIFKYRDLMKLCLKAKLTYIEIYAWQANLKKKIKTGPQTSTAKTIQFYEDLSLKQRQIQQCQKIFVDRKNNLISFAEFEIQIKNLKKLLKERLWEQSSNTLVCMKPVPLTTNGKSPIIQNLARKKNRFRKQIQKMVNPEIDLCSKFQILTKSKLKQEVQNGCTVLLLSANVKIIDSKPYFIFEGPRMQEDLLQINREFITQFQMSKIKILIVAGKNSSLAILALARLMDDPPFMISLGNVSKQEELDEFKQFQDDYKLTQNNYLIKVQQRRRAEVAFLKQFVRRLMQKQINSKQEIIQICQYCYQLITPIIQMKIQYSKRSSPILIHHKKGFYKDLSPGYQKNHNIDMKSKVNDNVNFISLRRWKQTYRVFEYIQRKLQSVDNSKVQNVKDQQSSVAYINIFGDIGSGKSSFVQQIARIFVQRQKFTSGVYIIDGKVVQKTYQGDFQTYFIKESQSGKIMTLQDFQKNGDQRLMLIIDDFHFIKPRSNGRFNLFLQKIVDKKINLIIVTNTIYLKQNSKQAKKDSIFLLKKIKPIRIDPLCPFEVDLIAYNTLDLTNKKLLEKYEEMKVARQGLMTVKDIIELKNNFYGKKRQHQFALLESKQMKKQQSNQV